MPPPTDYESFALGDVALQHGATLRDATLTYTTFGIDAALADLLESPGYTG